MDEHLHSDGKLKSFPVKNPPKKFNYETRPKTMYIGGNV